MVVKILGLADLAAALSILLLRFEAVPQLALILGVYEIIKGLVFIKSVTSIVDIAAGLAMLLAFYTHVGILTWIAAIWLTQKGVISVFS